MSTINTRRGTLKTDETEVPADSATSSRRNKNKEEQPPLDRPVEYLEDEPNIADMLQVCCQNLTIIRDFLLGCKENLHRRQACLLACDTMQNIIQKAQRHAVETTVTPALTQEIKKINKNISNAASCPDIQLDPQDIDADKRHQPASSCGRPSPEIQSNCKTSTKLQGRQNVAGHKKDPYVQNSPRAWYTGRKNRALSRHLRPHRIPLSVDSPTR
jgi:hypothetical protein